MTPRVPHPTRGSAMLITMMVIVGLLLLSAGIVTFTSKATNTANAMRRHEQLANCALAVRQYLASQLRFPSARAVNSLTFTIPGAGGKDIQLVGGHYDTLKVNGFQLHSTNGGTAGTVEELGNNVRTEGGTQATTGTATCTDAEQNQYEVEFSFAFGV